jgi:hypothetical protein
MKKHFVSTVVPLTQLSGIHWTPESGIDLGTGSSDEERAVWKEYVAVRGNPFNPFNLIYH